MAVRRLPSSAPGSPRRVADSPDTGFLDEAEPGGIRSGIRLVTAKPSAAELLDPMKLVCAFDLN